MWFLLHIKIQDFAKAAYINDAKAFGIHRHVQNIVEQKRYKYYPYIPFGAGWGSANIQQNGLQYIKYKHTGSQVYTWH